jgi:hypothetical protein
VRARRDGAFVGRSTPGVPNVALTAGILAPSLVARNDSGRSAHVEGEMGLRDMVAAVSTDAKGSGI